MSKTGNWSLMRSKTAAQSQSWDFPCIRTKIPRLVGSVQTFVSRGNGTALRCMIHDLMPGHQMWAWLKVCQDPIEIYGSSAVKYSHACILPQEVNFAH